MARPSFATITAVTALCVATGGVGYAAGTLPANSVGSKQIINGSIKSADVKDGAVTSAKVDDGSLGAADLAGSSVNGAKVADGSLGGADLAPNSVTGAQIDESTLSLPGQSGSIIVMGYDFHPRSSGLTYETATGSGDIRVVSGSDFMPARIDLPTGATITTVDFYVVDNGAGMIQLQVTRNRPAIGELLGYGYTETGGQSAAIQTVTLNVNETDDGISGWQLIARLPEGTSYRLVGAKVNYTAS